MIDLGMGIKAPQALDAPQNYAVEPLPLDQQLKLIAEAAAASALRHIGSSSSASKNTKRSANRTDR